MKPALTNKSIVLCIGAALALLVASAHGQDKEKKNTKVDVSKIPPASTATGLTYAKDVKERLDQANEKILFIDARSTGEVALLRRLSFELERLKPDHELIFREAQKKLIGATMAQQLAQKGYRYDPATAVMSKMEG